MLSIEENFIKKTFESCLVAPRVVLIEKNIPHIWYAHAIITTESLLINNNNNSILILQLFCVWEFYIVYFIIK